MCQKKPTEGLGRGRQQKDHEALRNERRGFLLPRVTGGTARNNYRREPGLIVRLFRFPKLLFRKKPSTWLAQKLMFENQTDALGIEVKILFCLKKD